MKVQIQKWGNSLALRIPKSFAIESKVSSGSTVEVSLDKGKIVVTPIAEPEIKLEDLLNKVSKRNIHAEIDSGSPLGKEVW